MTEVWSSGVAFCPQSKKYWRIGRKWYDFREFCDRHPGGPVALKLARDRFEDCTYVFEAHHHKSEHVCRIIKKYEVPSCKLTTSEELPSSLNPEYPPQLVEKGSFYFALRKNVSIFLKKEGYGDGGPKIECILAFWFIFFLWCILWYYTWISGSFIFASTLGIVSAWLGAFGHNWVHQPQYKAWAYLSLDPLGLSCGAWFREHNLQHHMYTNSRWDNHFKGTAPWLVTDPTVPRRVWQEITPFINPLILSFGVWASYIKHAIDIVKGDATFHPCKLLLIIECTAMIYSHGFSHGMLLMYTWTGILGVYFFSIALMNHNSKRCHDIVKRNTSRDWGESQVYTCADWSVDLGFFPSLLFLMLNYHTVHHLFPRVDFSHLPSIQNIVENSCREHNIQYEAGTFFNLYKEMVETFAVPQSPNEKVFVYTGGKKIS